MNCTVCGRYKQRKNLEGGVCRSCRRLAPVVAGVDYGSGESFSVKATVEDGKITGILPDDYEPSQNAQVEGFSADLSLEAFSRLHHNQQTRYLKDRGVLWEAGQDRIELFRSL